MVPFGLAWLTTASAGSDPCKRFKVEEDAFSGGSTISAVAQAVGPASFGPTYHMFGVALKLEGGAPNLVLTVRTNGAVQGMVPPGVPFAIKFSDGTVQNWATTEQAAAKPTAAGTSIVSDIPYVVGLDGPRLEALVASPITTIRLPVVEGGTQDWEASRGVQESVQLAAQCIKLHLPPNFTGSVAAPAAAPAPAPAGTDASPAPAPVP